MSAVPVRVLYIGGYGRSGSTLLDLALGQIPGFVSCGELKFVWQRGLRDDTLCGCGERFRACPFWCRVGDEAFGGWDAVDLDEILELERKVDRHRFVPFLVAPGLRPAYRRRLERYADTLGRLYAAVQRVSGASVIVDSTKHPSYALLLRQVAGIDLSVVHLVRDSRGVAFSWTKRVVRPEVVDAQTYMNTYRPARMGARWVTHNLLFHLLGRLSVPRTLVRYEDVVEAPAAELRGIVERIRPESHAWTDFVGDGVIELRPHHTVSGNPMRFSQGRIAVRLDDEWRQKLPPGHRRQVLALTWPLLVRYGYLGGGRR